MARVQISAADQGKQLALRVGDELVVRLPENPTTGYRWQVDSSGGAFWILDHDDFELPQNAAAGASGTRILAFRVTSAGHSLLCLELRRAWEQGQPPVQEFAISAEVRSS